MTTNTPTHAETAQRGANCPEKPERLAGQPIGQYHCPACGMMLIAGLLHEEPSRDNPDYQLLEEMENQPNLATARKLADEYAAITQQPPCERLIKMFRTALTDCEQRVRGEERAVIIAEIKAAYIYGPSNLGLERDGAMQARRIILDVLQRATPPTEPQTQPVAHRKDCGMPNCFICYH